MQFGRRFTQPQPMVPGNSMLTSWDVGYNVVARIYARQLHLWIGDL